MKLPSLISTIIVAILTAINVAPTNLAAAQTPSAENYVRTERRTSASGNTVTARSLILPMVSIRSTMVPVNTARSFPVGTASTRFAKNITTQARTPTA